MAINTFLHRLSIINAFRVRFMSVRFLRSAFRKVHFWPSAFFYRRAFATRPKKNVAYFNFIYINWAGLQDNFTVL